MASTAQYIQAFADVPFSEMPFNEADNFALCQAFYMPIEKAADTRGGKTVLFSEIAKRAFAQRGYKHRRVGLVLSKEISYRLMEMADTKRFGNILVTDCVDVFSTRPAVQFDAATFLLDDGTVVIVFRGTDDSIVGWKEDMDILVRGSIPSHRLAVDYLDRAASRHPGEIVICGHSKGGNVALYAALHCKKETRDRIRTLYNNEGPGFADDHHYSTEAYKELLPRYRHFVPQAAFIGMMLAHDNDYTVIESGKLLGASQHDLSFWHVNGAKAVYRKRLTPQGRFYDLFFRKFQTLLPQEKYEFFDNLANELLEGVGELYLSGLAANAPVAFRNAKSAWKRLAAEKKAALRESLPDMGDVLSDTVKDLSEEAREEFKTLAEEARENISGTVKETRENVRTIAEETLENVRTLREETRENVRSFAEGTQKTVKSFAEGTRETIVGTVKNLTKNEQDAPEDEMEALPADAAPATV
ncbi:MAG: DUF2974 domain-containing protein [Clostridia bacterium]|nr:DUF2974 domain-containing protein [Clostridia bacterium]